MAKISSIKDGLATLLDALASIAGLRWLRFLYAYPQPHNRPFARHNRETRQHLQVSRPALPLQHASADVLKRMKRGSRSGHLPEDSGQGAHRDSRDRSSHVIYRRFPRRNSPRLRNLEDFIGEAKFATGSVSFASDEEGSVAHSLDAKVAKRTIESQTPFDETSAIHQQACQGAMDWSRTCSSGRRRGAKRRQCSGKAAPSFTRRKSMARST